jgi:hypothetical protein
VWGGHSGPPPFVFNSQRVLGKPFPSTPPFDLSF